MLIREAEQQDLVRVSAICMRAFMRSVAPGLSSQGVDTFRAISTALSFEYRLAGDNRILVYTDAGEVQGVIELKEGSHVAMLFVDPEYQNSGIGRQLLTAVMAYARTDLITVHASLNAVPAYLKYGFVCVDEPAEKAGIKYQPMELHSSSHPTAG